MAKSTRRTANTGSVYQRADGYWCAAINLPSSGKRRRKVIVRKTRDAALTALRKATKDLADKGDLPTASPTLSQWIDLWWDRYATPRLKVTTRDSYRSAIDNYIKPAIGRVRLDKLTVDHMYRLRDYITGEKHLSPTTALGAHNIVSKILADAERESRITRNVAALAEKPRKVAHQSAWLTNAQARDLLLATRDAGWAVALLTGMRQGERLGLTVDAVDFARHQIVVEWQLQRLTFEHGCADSAACKQRGGYCPKRMIRIPPDQEAVLIDSGYHLIRPKSKAGWRTVPMSPLLEGMLLEHMETHKPGMSGLIFTRPDGRPIPSALDDEAWKKALAASKLPHVGIHSARHTCNTILTELGVPVDVRQAILGHASRAINEGIYTHTSDVRVAAAMEKMGNALDWRDPAAPAAIKG